MDNKTPALILGGSANILAITRSLSRQGVPVYVSAKSDCAAFQSRYPKKRFLVADENDPLGYWEDLLIKNKSLAGCVVLACSDDGVEFLAKYRAELENDYILDHFKPELMLKMLDKQETLRLAKSLDIPVPNFWNIDTIEDVHKVKDEILYPVIIKPINSHIFQRHYDGKKYLLVENYEELVAQVAGALEHGLQVMLTEKVPGPDTLLSSYYTYIDDKGKTYFGYTKQILRRYPKNIGGASYHITQHHKETEALGKKFFEGIGYVGLGNIEFKRDERDGKLKVIECNPRFTAAQPLLVKAGVD
ncbi:MAG: ATP-grasp domain-containing protein, partial [Gammaproteobacteria bacterium]|nr:ATP-grasp domain-containing protein [Gammaproteobacteria bacterium]